GSTRPRLRPRWRTRPWRRKQSPGRWSAARSPTSSAISFSRHSSTASATAPTPPTFSASRSARCATSSTNMPVTVCRSHPRAAMARCVARRKQRRGSVADPPHQPAEQDAQREGRRNDDIELAERPLDWRRADGPAEPEPVQVGPQNNEGDEGNQEDDKKPHHGGRSFCDLHTGLLQLNLTKRIGF